MTFGMKTAAGVLGAASLLALTAGCATTSSQMAYESSYSGPEVGPDRLYRNDFVKNTRPETRQLELAMAEPAPSSDYYAQSPYGQPQLNLASFDGIEGARRAHKMYSEAQAEKLDGACERFVTVARYENLYDIERLCDVRVSVLLAYNPRLRDARHVGEGAIIEVPQTFNPERAAYIKAAFGSQQPGAHSGAVAYVVQPGDTLNDIAARHLVSAAAVANSNPETDWQYLQVGATVWIPASNPTHPGGAPVLPSAPSAPMVHPSSSTGGLPYNFGASHASGVTYDTSTVMPYQMTPGQQAAEQEGPRTLLMITSRVGDEVELTGERLGANREVSIYRGANGTKMEYVGTVTTKSDGSFTESFEVPSDTGGVIFQATVDGEKRAQSPRVVSPY